MFALYACMQHGMGSLRITDTGIRLEGAAEFLGPLYAQSIEADSVRAV